MDEVTKSILDKVEVLDEKVEFDVETTNAINTMVKNQIKGNDTRLEEIIGSAKQSEGYMLGLTLLNGGELKHYFIVKSFPDNDVLKSLKEIKELAIKKLEA